MVHASSSSGKKGVRLRQCVNIYPSIVQTQKRAELQCPFGGAQDSFFTTRRTARRGKEFGTVVDNAHFQIVHFSSAGLLGCDEAYTLQHQCRFAFFAWGTSS